MQCSREGDEEMQGSPTEEMMSRRKQLNPQQLASDNVRSSTEFEDVSVNPTSDKMHIDIPRKFNDIVTSKLPTPEIVAQSFDAIGRVIHPIEQSSSPSAEVNGTITLRVDENSRNSPSPVADEDAQATSGMYCEMRFISETDRAVTNLCLLNVL